ncbi:MAG: hypothetical protein AB8D78_00630 [Akkermansiaceae bacterium]
MIPAGDSQRPPTLLIFWIIWFAIFNGLFVIQFFAAGGFPSGSNEGDVPLWSIAVPAVLLVAAVAVRFLVIPRLMKLTALLPAMVIGLAFSEGIGILGMFAVGKEFPETRLALFVVSVCAVLMYAPIYANAVLIRDKMR